MHEDLKKSVSTLDVAVEDESNLAHLLQQFFEDMLDPTKQKSLIQEMVTVLSVLKHDDLTIENLWSKMLGTLYFKANIGTLAKEKIFQSVQNGLDFVKEQYEATPIEFSEDVEENQKGFKLRVLEILGKI